MPLKPSFSLIENHSGDYDARTALIGQIIATYSGLIRPYAVVRFKIIHLRFLEEMAQYLPDDGDILDLGCGFGLYALFMAACKPSAQIIGLDLNVRRLEIAQASARKLGLRNVRFERQDLRDWTPDREMTGAYALDVFHHIPVTSGDALLRSLFAHLKPGGGFLLKDIDTRPRSMLWFTYLLDLLMSPRDRFFYRSGAAWREQLTEIGFEPVYLHYLWDILPYPHVLFICSKPDRAR